MKIIAVLITGFLWILLSTIMNRILKLIIDKDTDIDDLIIIGTVLSPLSCVFLTAYGIILLFIKISNSIVDNVIKIFNTIKDNKNE